MQALRLLAGRIAGKLMGSLAKITEDGPELVSIGQLARDAGVSSRTIRYYEELGIIPEPCRSAGGTRKYPRQYRGYVETALALKDLGFRLDEIGPLARLALGWPAGAGQREAAERLVEDRIDVLGQQLTVLRRLRESVRCPDITGPAQQILGWQDQPEAPSPPGAAS